MTVMTDLRTEVGTIARVTYFAADSGFAILQVERGDFSTFTAKGTMPDAAKGLEVELSGEWQQHPKFGKQFSFMSYSVPDPVGEDGMIAFLSTLKGIKESKAKAIYAHFGDEILDILEEDCDRLLEVSGIGPKTLPKIAESYQKMKGMRNLISFLADIGVSAGYAARIYRVYGANSIGEIKQNPYILAEEVRGFGFKKADEVALKMGIKPESRERAIAGIMHVLKLAASQQGHCYLLKDQLTTDVCSALALPDYRPQMSDIESVVGSLERVNTKKGQRLVADGDRVYLHSYFEAEEHLAIALQKLAGEFVSKIDIEQFLFQYQAENGITLAEQQREAVETVARNGLTVVTGGAGVGKLQPNDEPVLTPDGWVRMGDIKPGDYVISKDGRPTRVLATYPGKDLEIYRVNFDDGTWTECCIDHLWEVQTLTQKDKSKRKVVPLKEMLERINRPKKAHAGYYYAVDFCDPVEFAPKELPIHPYLLGWLIGDGYLPEDRQVAIATWIKDSEEIFEKLFQYLPENVTAKLYPAIPSTPTVRKLVFSSEIRKYLKDVGLLGCKSGQKFIPESYLYSSVSDRKFLLSGLIDTDGTISSFPDEKARMRFSTSSAQLAKDVAELVRSLGGRAKIASYVRSGTGVAEFNVTIRLMFNPFLLRRKQEIYGDHRYHYSYQKRIVSADYVGQKDGQCILVEHPSHLYITRGYTVTHNTTISKAVVQFWHKQGKRIVASCPTGKGAQRIREATGLMTASTIHRLLGWNGNGFTHGAENPIEADAFLIDEFSMTDLRLANSLFQAIPPHAVVMIVGDVNQLPSVGAGNVLRDIIESGEVPVVKLTQVFRQAATSRIIQSSLSINAGKFPELEQISRSTGKPSSDALWINCSADRIQEAIAWLLTDKLPEMGWSQDDIQVLSPMHKGDTGNIALNTMIQNAWNPAKRGAPTVGGFREWDRVIQTVNNYDKKVFNGDIGKIEAIDQTEKEVQVRFPDLDDPMGRVVTYDFNEMDDLMLAFSISIHKSQGSEFPVVIIPATMSQYMMLQRNLYYTGVTRGKKLVIVVGEEKAIQTAVRTQKLNQRNTALAERIQGA